ncbi:MAG: alpha-L-fucosidase [Clostridia bacterium]|nr:alpha-L-fucosidase [Clostridia bacterium]
MTHENKFGMFIHWGIYSLTGLQEQAFSRYGLDRAEYEALKDRFDPVDYDPEKWVLLAKSCGMEYICFTAKHHDGFCMWDTKYTDYNIMNTPYGKDTLKMLADACAKHGLQLSLYYSNPDWNHPFGYNPKSTHQWKAVNKDAPDTEKYREFVKKQITELLTGYGKIYSFFWDIPTKIEDPSMNELIRRLQPGIYINDRGWDKGDFSTPEREYQAAEGTRFTRMTEANNSVGQQSWGYREKEDFYSIRHLTHAIDRYMSMGASYLLNAGPDSKGVITEEYAKRFRIIGDWYNRMKGCLVCHEEDTYNYESRHNKCIATKKNGRTYLHFYDGIMSDAVNLKNYPGMPKSIRLMNTDTELNASIEPLPEYFNPNGVAEVKFLHIRGIPVDELQNEPIVIEIEW